MNTFGLQSQPVVSFSEFFSIANYNIQYTESKKDLNDNYVIIATKTDPISLEMDPVVIKYDGSGNLMMQWIYSDSLLNEYPVQFALIQTIPMSTVMQFASFLNKCILSLRRRTRLFFYWSHSVYHR